MMENKKNDNKEVETSKFFEEKEEKEGTQKDWKIVISRDLGINIGIALFFCHLIYLIFKYLVAISKLRAKVISNNPIYILLAIAIPIVLWICSTLVDEWNYHNRKLFFFYAVITDIVLVILQPVYTSIWRLIIPNIFKIETNPALTEGMIILLGQIIMTVSMIVTICIIGAFFGKIFMSPHMNEMVKTFKISHHVDMRDNKEYQYDLSIVNDLETGKPIIVNMKDRFLHIFINGASGTGKTSSVYLPAWARDMDKKFNNFIIRIKELIKMLLQRHAYIDRTEKLDEYCIKPVKGYENEYQKIYEKIPDCGMTLIAPNNAVIKDVLKLAEAKNQTVYVIDPAKDWSKDYRCAVNAGINPFYLRFGLQEDMRQILIQDIASDFTAVLVAVNEKDGKSEVYFTDIMKSMCMNIATVCVLARNIEKKQTDIIEVQQCIINPRNMVQMVKTIESYFGIYIEVESTQKKGKSNELSAQDIYESMQNSQTPVQAADKKKKAKDNPYYSSIYWIKTELLGEGEKDMFQQGRGLRNLISKFIGDPRIKAVLTADEKARIDFDDLLSKCQITVVNTALEFGSEKSTALGLFTLMSFKAAVVRRPDGYRAPHFLTIDEGAQYMHPMLEDFVALFRQYWVSIAFAVQGLEQFEKNELTKYLKGVFMKVGTQIVFGRISKDEMDTYSSLAGEFDEEAIQKTVTETSIFSDNPSVSSSERTSVMPKSKLSGTKIRLMDFQEITILSVRDGRVLPGRFGKVHFLSKRDFRHLKNYEINWNELGKRVLVQEPVDVDDKLDNMEMDIKIDIPDHVMNTQDDYLESMEEREHLIKIDNTQKVYDKNMHVNMVANEIDISHGTAQIPAKRDEYEAIEKEEVKDHEPDSGNSKKKPLQYWEILQESING